jgi:predicted AlkP superfamily pyrophosphatase or phosphodiesterase
MLLEMNLKYWCRMERVACWGRGSARRIGRLGAAALAASVVLTACQGWAPTGSASSEAVPDTPVTQTTPPPPDWRQRPRLVVLFVIDGLPQRQVLAYRDQLAADGFARFLDQGAWYTDAHHGHAFTVTAAGHSVMLTGAYPSTTGIIANEWRDAMTGQPEYCTADTHASYIGHATQALDGTSPKNLKVDTVGDVLRRLDPRAKVLGISGKDRGAILPAGHAGTAYMYMAQTGFFASSTYYMQKHPAWVDAFNAEHPADRWFKKEWKPLLKEEAYQRSLPDRQPWYGARNALPLLMGAPSDEAPTPTYYSQLLASPFADQLTLEFARAAIAGEGLGRDEVPDILSISLSGHDYVNHRYSAESRFSHDHFLQLDRMLQDFFRELDRTVGRDQYVAMLTADHGFMPAPEQSAKQGMRSGKINGGQLLARLNAGMEQNFGPGKWVSYSGSSLLLNKQLISQQHADPDEVANTARDLLLEEPGIAVAYTRRELAEGSKPEGAFFMAARRSWHPDVSGDIQYVVKPYWMFGSSTNVATHGSPYPYDTQVPILAWGPRWVKPGQVDERVGVVDIAPTVSKWLGIAPPSTSEGVVLPVPTAAPKDKSERQ